MVSQGVTQAMEKASALLMQQGSVCDRLRCEILLGQREEECIGQLEAALGDARGVAEVLRHLSVLGDLQLLGKNAAELASQRAAALQDSDGGWTLGESEESQRLIATGMLAGYLAKTRFVRPQTLQRAGNFLEAHWSPERVQIMHWPTIAAFAHFFSHVDSELSDAALQWCGRELERGFRLRRFTALGCARVFSLCGALALPGARLTADELLLSLLAEQSEDGSWKAPEALGEFAGDFEATHWGLVALQQLACVGARSEAL